MILSRLTRPMLKRQNERAAAERRELSVADSAKTDGRREMREELTQVTVLQPGQAHAYIQNAGPPTQPLWRVAVPDRRPVYLGPRLGGPVSLRTVDFESVMMAVDVSTGDDLRETVQLVWWEWRPRGHTAFPVKSATRPRGGSW